MWRAWAVISSIVVGVLVASLLGGTPSGAGYILGGAGIAAVVVLIVTAIREQHRIRRGIPEQPVEPTYEHGALDRDMVLEIRRIASSDDVYWLAGVDFTSPWRANRMDTWTNLIAYRARGHVAHDPGLDLAFDVLVESATSFLEAYEQNTFSDALVVSQEWREVGLSGIDPADLSSEERSVLDQRRVLLKARAAAVVDAYQRFSRIARDVTGA